MALLRTLLPSQPRPAASPVGMRRLGGVGPRANPDGHRVPPMPSVDRHPVSRRWADRSGTRWNDRDAARCLWSTIDELTREFGGRYAEARVVGLAFGAFRDLHGSAPLDALPELISRLVRVRLPGAGAGAGPAAS